MISARPFSRGRVPLLALAALLFALPAAAQQRGFTMAEIQELLRSDVSSTRVLLLVQQRCIHFEPDEKALAVLAAAGATAELLEGLRGPGQCRTDRSAAATPARPGEAGAPHAPAARRRGRPLAFLGAGYANGSFTPRGSDGDGAGQGAAVEFGVGGSHFAVFARGAYVGITPSRGEPYELGHTDLGARVIFLPVRAVVRPYVDVAASVIEMQYTGEAGAAGESATGFGISGGGGVRIAFSPKLALDASYRHVVGSLDGVETDGTRRDGVRGSGGWVMVGLSWTPGANRSAAP